MSNKRFNVGDRVVGCVKKNTGKLATVLSVVFNKERQTINVRYDSGVLETLTARAVAKSHHGGASHAPHGSQLAPHEEEQSSEDSEDSEGDEDGEEEEHFHPQMYVYPIC
jgi:hypothetical protein